MTTQISAAELQLLVYKYLKESGFEHSAYVFSTESSVAKSEAATADVPPGALISFIHKGLLFTRLEKDVEAKRARLSKDASNNESDNGNTIPPGILLLKAHQSAVYAVAFHPIDGNIVASGSGDPFARIWVLQPNGLYDQRGLEHSSILNKPDDMAVETNGDKLSLEKGKNPFSVPTLAWSPNGEILATACLDGRIRLWNKEGETLGSLFGNGAVFALKWSANGKYLLSGGDDKSVNVWEVATNSLKHSFELQGRTLDVDWRPNFEDGEDMFAASCGKSIAICQISSLKTTMFPAHDKDINSIKWSSDGKTLATCSDDGKTKLWDFSTEFEGTPSCVELVGHTDSVYTIKWSPATGADKPRIIVTASFDHTARIWDATTGAVIHTLKEHAGPIFAAEFDFSGETLVTGSNDGLLNFWNVSSGSLLKAIKLPGGVFDISWNVRGDKIAAALSSADVAIVDF